jgi:hypothetical protein
MQDSQKQSGKPAAINQQDKKKDSKTALLTKSDYPKTPKQTLKLIVNLIINFFPF